MSGQVEKRAKRTSGSEASTAVRRTSRLDDPHEVMRRISGLADKLEAALMTVGSNGNVRDLTALSREVRGLYEMCAKVSGLLSDKISVQIIQSPVFARFRERIENAVIDCPRCSAQYEQALQDAADAGRDNGSPSVD